MELPVKRVRRPFLARQDRKLEAAVHARRENPHVDPLADAQRRVIT